MTEPGLRLTQKHAVLTACFCFFKNNFRGEFNYRAYTDSITTYRGEPNDWIYSFADFGNVFYYS